MKAYALEILAERFSEKTRHVNLSLQKGEMKEQELTPNTSGLQSKLEAKPQTLKEKSHRIRVALEKVININHKKVVVLVNSWVYILAETITADNEYNKVKTCRYLAHQLMLHATKLVLQWILSHCKIQINEEATKPANKGL